MSAADARPFHCIGTLDATRDPWSVSIEAQAAGLAALASSFATAGRSRGSRRKHVRLAARSRPDHDRLLAALRSVM